MMMKKLIKTLGFILAVAWPSIVMAAPRTDHPQWGTNLNPNEIRNKVCIESPQTETKCDQVKIIITDDSYACESLVSSGSIVELTWTNQRWYMRFTCNASDSNPHTIKIECGNWDGKEATNVSSLTYNCKYSAGDEWDTFNASCLIDWQQNPDPSCIKNIWINPGLYWQCGNGIIEAGESCDLEWDEWESILIWDYLDAQHKINAGQFANNNYRCKNCTIMDGWGFVYNPAECLYSDTPISVMDNEIMPFWWRLWLKDNVLAGDNECHQIVPTFDEDKASKQTTKIKKSSMKCTFSIYNWVNKLQWNGGSSAVTFELPCFVWENEFYSLPIFKYFRKPNNHGTTASWSSYATVNMLLWWLKKITTYWEYKLVLEKVSYQYCDTNKWDRVRWKRYGAICEVDFAVTKPYMMQVSTFGVNPVATSAWFLSGYYDMKGSWIIEKTDLKQTIKTDNEDYAVSSDAKKQIDSFIEKYWKLAVTINKNTVSDLWLNKNEIESISKVPNQSIYFIKWKWWALHISQDKKKDKTTAYTLIVEDADIEIEWDMYVYAMIVAKDWTISFKDWWDPKGYRCKEWWQVVQWIFIALWWFKAGESLKNTSPNDQRCARWGLHVKWVLIWNNIENLMDGRRSQLNSWFNVNYVWWSDQRIKTDRKKKIMEWAALLIEYSPELWKSLPPWADIFTESLEVYRK